mmetsp:Transcript_52148/g.77254  ORF Transcript_52148/g.77254 Transcript_52148/m.77254 type:complete len:167 (+) Transcript_52148:133-633(+)
MLHTSLQYTLEKIKIRNKSDHGFYETNLQINTNILVMHGSLPCRNITLTFSYHNIILSKYTIKITFHHKNSQKKIRFDNSKLDGHANQVNIFVQAYPDSIGTTKLSSIWKGGTGTPKTVLGMHTAGVGTARSASAPASPKEREAKMRDCLPPGIPSAPHLAMESIL